MLKKLALSASLLSMSAILNADPLRLDTPNADEPLVLTELQMDQVSAGNFIQRILVQTTSNINVQVATPVAVAVGVFANSVWAGAFGCNVFEQ